MLSKTSLSFLVCLCLVCSTNAAKQESVPAKADTAPADLYSMGLPPTPQTLNIEFRGGDLMTLIEAIKQQNDGAVPNVVISDDVRGVEIPPFRLVNVAFFELMEALDAIDIGLDIDTPTDNVSTIGKKYTMAMAPSKVEIYSLRRLLDPEGPLHLKMDDIATAIRTAWDMIREPGEPNMKVHQETGLLIVRGSEEEQEVVKTVISRLSDQLQEAEGALWRRSQEEIKKMKAEHAQRLEQMSAKHAQDVKLRDKIFEDDLIRLREDYKSLKARHEDLLAEYETLKRENQ